MTTERKARGLGRGLSALMADVQVETSEGTGRNGGAVRHVPVERITPNPRQPRRFFAEDAMEELAASIREKGIIQPLILRRAGDGYEIVAGERRWRAAQMAQLHDVPAILRDFDDTEVLEIAIIENIQRADLNPIDEATGYRQLMERFGRTQDQMSKALGKSRSHIANLLRLLTLPASVQEMLSRGALSTGHARALITTGDPSALAQVVVSRGLSVRETERLAKGRARPTTAPRRPVEKDADTRALELDLAAAVGMPVTIDHRGARGSVTIAYRDLAELDGLCRRLSGDA